MHRPPTPSHPPKRPAAHAPAASTPPTPSPASGAPLPGAAVVRRILFQATTQREAWWLDMLTAIQAAQRLGVTAFEIALQGEHERSALSARDREVMVAQHGLYGGGFAGTISTGGPAAATVTVYALVVE